MTGRSRPYLIAAVLVASAGPTIIWALSGGDLLTDDWTIAARVEFRGFWASFGEVAWKASGRPVAALVYSTQYAIFGTHPLPSFVVLAGLNVVAALLVVRVAERLMPPRLAVLTALTWAVLPNRGSTRLWSAMLPAVLALALLLVAVVVLLGDASPPVLAGALIGLATLAYEAVFVVGIVALAVWAWKLRPAAWPRAVSVAAVPLAAAAYVYLSSPKRGSLAAPFTHASQIFHAHVGAGTFGPGVVALVCGTFLLARVVLAVVRMTLPSFGPPAPEDRWVLAGAAVLFFGALPFLVSGFPFATDGIFDRGNLVADLGTSLLIAATLAGLVGARQRRVAWGVVVAALGWMTALNGVDVADYRAAVRDGRQLLARLDEDLPVVPEGGVVVVPPLPNRGGVAMFILEGDLRAHLQLERGHRDVAPVRMALEGEKLDAAPEAYAYNWMTRQLTRTAQNSPE